MFQDLFNFLSMYGISLSYFMFRRYRKSRNWEEGFPPTKAEEDINLDAATAHPRKTKPKRKYMAKEIGLPKKIAPKIVPEIEEVLETSENGLIEVHEYDDDMDNSLDNSDIVVQLSDYSDVDEEGHSRVVDPEDAQVVIQKEDDSIAPALEQSYMDTSECVTSGNEDTMPIQDMPEFSDFIEGN